MRKNTLQQIAVILFMIGLLCSCSDIKSSQAIVTETSEFTQTPFPTYTLQATYTPYPTVTPYVVKLEIPQSEGQDYWPSKPLDRDYYAYVDTEIDKSVQDFRQAYTEALETGAAWIEDPITVALRYAGYPNVDCPNPTKVFFFSTSYNDIVIVIVSENRKDDSVRDHEDRVDLVKVENTWKIEWAGYRQRCYRTTFDGWIAGLCP